VENESTTGPCDVKGLFVMGKRTHCTVDKPVDVWSISTVSWLRSLTESASIRGRRNFEGAFLPGSFHPHQGSAKITTERLCKEIKKTMAGQDKGCRIRTRILFIPQSSASTLSWRRYSYISLDDSTLLWVVLGYCIFKSGSKMAVNSSESEEEESIEETPCCCCPFIYMIGMRGCI